MHAAGEHPPDTRQAHRIAQAWQLSNEIRGGAAKGRYILAVSPSTQVYRQAEKAQMGDFNSQPFSVPVAILRYHASLKDSFLDTHPNANESPASPPSPQMALSRTGMTCDSPLNTYSHGKPIPHEVLSRGGKRLDYIFYRQPEVARRRPLIWGYRDNFETNEMGAGRTQHLEEGKPLNQSISSAPKLRCVKSEVVLTERVPGQPFSYSDHFALCSVFTIDFVDSKKQRSQGSSAQPAGSGNQQASFRPLVPLISEPEPLGDTTTTFAPIDPPRSPTSTTSPLSSRTSMSPSAKSSCLRGALNTLRMYTRISQNTARKHMRFFFAAVVCLLGLTVGSAWQPKSWIQPVFTLAGGALGAAGATTLYTGFIWGRWEEGILKEVTEEMELELRVVEMEERAAAS